MTPQPKKLLVFCPLYPPSVGGLQNHAQQFNAQMVKRGNTVIVYTPHISGGETYEQDASGAQIYRFPAIELPANWPIPAIWRMSFWRQLQEIQAELRTTTHVVSRTRFFTTSLLAWIMARWHRKPWLHIEHGSDYPQFGSTLLGYCARLYDHTLGRAVLKRADAVITVSKAAKRFVTKLADRPSTVVYRGIIPSVFTEATPAKLTKYGIDDHTPIILYVGRLITGKGVQDLLRAFIDLQHPHAHLVVAGSGPAESQLLLQAQNHPRVHFIGEKDAATVANLLKRATVCVNPSYTEGLPSIAIEARMAGCPVIATNVGGTREIPGVELVGPHAPHDLRTALERMVNKPSLSGEPGASEIRKLFSWTTSMEKYEHVLTELTRSHE